MKESFNARLTIGISQLPVSDQNAIEAIVFALMTARQMESVGKTDQKIKKISKRFEEIHEVAKEIQEQSLDRWSRGEDQVLIIIRDKLREAFARAKRMRQTNLQLQKNLMGTLISCDFEFEERDREWLSSWMKRAASIEGQEIDYSWDIVIKDEAKKLAEFAVEYLFNPEGKGDRVQAKDLRWIEERLEYL